MPGRDKDLKEYKKFYENVIDLYIPINEIYKIPELVKKHYKKVKYTLNYEDYLDLEATREEKFRAFVPIINGCNNFCSYCAVPYARGREKSRNFKSVIDEVINLKERNYKEITLLGQNVNSFNPIDLNESKSKDNPYSHPFACLLWEVNKTGIPRIYFTSSHPKDMSDEVIDALKLENMGNYIHLAIQSGSDDILEGMNRKYKVENYLDKIDKIRRIKPEIAIGTDIIVGFPGETEKDFQKTCDIYKKVKFDISYPAIYSDRSGTVAFEMPENIKIDNIKKKERRDSLQKIMEDITLEKNQKYLNKNLSVLVDGRDGDYLKGNSKELKIVKFKGDDDLIGEIVNINIKEIQTWNLYGELIKDN
jgi:tRNA-2-methylthio-N6-dimethylallyladenosine synthase